MFGYSRALQSFAGLHIFGSIECLVFHIDLSCSSYAALVGGTLWSLTPSSGQTQIFHDHEFKPFWGYFHAGLFEGERTGNENGLYCRTLVLVIGQPLV